MSSEAVVYVVLGATALLILIVLAPWRGFRKDALGERDTYSALSGEERQEEI